MSNGSAMMTGMAHPELELQLLGDFEVRRDGQTVSLPPSKKTRALLAYLVMNPRRFRREFLCELLWEIPDDPRGSLRWSLSKLRRAVNEPDEQRIKADRSYVEIDTSDMQVDALELRTLAASDLSQLPLERLEASAKHLRGTFLEGLSLSNLHDFHAWCVAEREQVARAQTALLKSLIARLIEEPERALPYARSLVAISPYDEEQRALLIRTLVKLNYIEESEEQYRLGLRMLREIGVVPSGLMDAARNRMPARCTLAASEAPSRQNGSSPQICVSSGLVGRDREAGILAGLFNEVLRTGKARFALVHGEPGIGKTRLLDAVRALAVGAGANELTARAYESESIRPFALWIDALRRHDRKIAAEVFGDSSEDGNRDRLFDRISEVIARCSTERPQLLVFDDLHWCDESSAAAVHYVVRTNRDDAVFCVLAARDGEMPDNLAVQQLVSGLKREGVLVDIHLGPLSEKVLYKLITERAPAAQAELLSRQCGGNPLLAIELARAEESGEGSTSLTDLVRDRLARFSLDAVEVLQWAAVLSPHIDLEAIASLAGFDSDFVSKTLDITARKGMLSVTGEGLRFSHDLLARAVYASLSPLRRQVMHRRVAELLEQRPSLELSRAAELAHHASQSGHPGLEGRALVSAGRMCLRFYANDEALNLYRRGMQVVDQLPDSERICTLIDLHDIRLAAAPLEDWEASAQLYVELAEKALDHGELAHARLGYHMAAYLRWAHGQWTYAREQSLQSERVARSATEEEQIVGMAETAKCLVMIERDLSKADAMLMEAQSLSSRKGFAHYAIPAGLGMLRFHQDKLDEAIELLTQSRTLCKSVGARIDEFQTVEYLMMIEFHRRRYDQAKAYSRLLEGIGDKLREGSEAPFAHAVSALCDYAMDDESRPLETALDALRLADAKHRLAYTLTRAAQLDFARGRIEMAATRATEALEYATLLQRATEIALARSVLKRVADAQGDFETARAHDTAIRALESQGIAIWAYSHVLGDVGSAGVARN